jgi:hypothetical protein
MYIGGQFHDHQVHATIDELIMHVTSRNNALLLVAFPYCL